MSMEWSSAIRLRLIPRDAFLLVCGSVGGGSVGEVGGIAAGGRAGVVCACASAVGGTTGVMHAGTEEDGLAGDNGQGAQACEGGGMLVEEVVLKKEED